MAKRNKKSNIVGVILGLVVVLAAIGGVSVILKNNVKDTIINKNVDNSRVAITAKGSVGKKSVSAYVFFQHPELDESEYPVAWPGITAKDEIDKYDYVHDNKDGTYTIELTSLLPLGYYDYSDFLSDGGSCGVVLSFGSDENLIQSKDFFLEESGNHHLTLPTHNYGEITDSVVKFVKTNGNKVDDEVSSSSSITETSSDSASESTNTSTSSSVDEEKEIESTTFKYFLQQSSSESADDINYELESQERLGNWVIFNDYTINYGNAYRVKIEKHIKYTDQSEYVDTTYSNDSFEWGSTGSGTFYYRVAEVDFEYKEINFKGYQIFQNGLYFVDSTNGLDDYGDPIGAIKPEDIIVGEYLVDEREYEQYQYYVFDTEEFGKMALLYELDPGDERYFENNEHKLSCFRGASPKLYFIDERINAIFTRFNDSEYMNENVNEVEFLPEELNEYNFKYFIDLMTQDIFHGTEHQLIDICLFQKMV